MELTQEQLDAIVAEKVSQARTGLFTEEDLQKRVTSEVDRRVETGIQKGLETYKSKWQKELEDKANMTAEELARKQLESQMAELNNREKEIKKKSNQLNAKDLLANAEIPKTQYEKVIDLLVSDDEELTKTNVQNFVEMFNSTKTEIETKIKTELSKITPPAGGNGEQPVTKEAFTKMSYADKLKFKQDNPELYSQFIK